MHKAMQEAYPAWAETEEGKAFETEASEMNAKAKAEEKARHEANKPAEAEVSETFTPEVSAEEVKALIAEESVIYKPVEPTSESGNELETKILQRKAGVKDVAMYCRQTPVLTYQQAEESGLVPKGQDGAPQATWTMGATIAQHAPEPLFQSYTSGEKTQLQAYKLAEEMSTGEFSVQVARDAGLMPNGKLEAANGTLRTFDGMFETISVADAAKNGIMKDGKLEASNGTLYTIGSASFAIRARHASPHSGIRKFLMQFIGTGEGAQAYGHGLYFSTSMGVHESYVRQFGIKGNYPAKDKLRKMEGMAKFHADDFVDELQAGIKQPEDWEFFRDDYIAYFKKEAQESISNIVREAAAKAAKDFEGLLLDELVDLSVRGAAEYEVMLNVERNGNNLLHWDEPVSQDLIEKLGMVEAMSDFYNPKGRKLWVILQNQKGSGRAATEALLSAGIKGVEYRDATSRNDGEDITYNYVVFDEADIKVVRVKDHETGYEWQDYEDAEATFALSPTLRTDITEAWHHRTKSKTRIPLCSCPSVFRALGLPDADIVTQAATISKLRNKHKLSADEIVEAVEGFDDPVLVYEDTDGSIIIVPGKLAANKRGNMTDEIAPIKLEETPDGKHFMASLYPLENLNKIETQLKRGKLLYSKYTQKTLASYSNAPELSPELMRLQVGQGFSAQVSSSNAPGLSPELVRLLVSQGFPADAITKEDIVKPSSATFAIFARHASPHSGIRKFLMQFIGTGEGAQAYGHGLYFSTSEGVHRSYVRQFRNRYKELVRPADNLPSEVFYLVRAVAHEVGAGHSKEQVMERFRNGARERYEREKETLEYWEKSLEERKQEEGYYRDEDMIAVAERNVDVQRMEVAHYKKQYDTTMQGTFDDFFVFNEGVNASEYEVMLNFERNGENLLRWDERIPAGLAQKLGMIDAEEFAAQDKGFKKWAKKNKKEAADRADIVELVHVYIVEVYMKEQGTDAALAQLDKMTSFNTTGEKLYKQLAKIQGSPEGASKAFLAAGIKGIEYRDGSSRNDGADITYNYVVFDEADIKVVRVKDHETAYEWKDYVDPTATFSIHVPLLNTVGESKAALKPAQGRVYENTASGVRAKVTNQTLGKTHSTQMSVANLKAMGYSDEEARMIHYSAVARIHELFEQAEHWFFEDNYDTKQKAGRRGAYHFFGMVEVEGFGEFNANVSVVAPTDLSFDNRIFTLELTIENPTEVRQDSLSQRGLSNSSVGSSELRVAAYRSFVEKEKAAIRKKAEAEGVIFSDGGVTLTNGVKSNLTPEQWLMVRTKAFKDWFGDWENDPKNASKMLDMNGEPLVVYHGTHEDFSAFEEGDSWSARAGGAIWFSDNKATAETYGRHGGRVMGVFIKAINPKFVDAKGKTHKEVKVGSRRGTGEIARGVNRKKHDAVIFLNIKDYATLVGEDIPAATSVAIFKPTQIKSATDNRGTFDPQNPDITFSLATGRSLGKVSPRVQYMQNMIKAVDAAGGRWQALFADAEYSMQSPGFGRMAAQQMGSIMGLAMKVYHELPRSKRKPMTDLLRRAAVYARMVEDGKVLTYGQVPSEERARLKDAVLDELAASWRDKVDAAGYDAEHAGLNERPEGMSAQSEKELWRQAAAEAARNVGAAEIGKVYTELAEAAAEQMKAYLKEDALAAIDKVLERFTPKKDKKSGKLKRGIAHADTYREVEELGKLINKSEKERDEAMQELMGKIDALPTTQDGALTAEDEAKREKLEAELDDWTVFGAARHRDWKAAQVARERLMNRAVLGIEAWRAREAYRKAQNEALVARTLRAIGSPDEGKLALQKGEAAANNLRGTLRGVELSGTTIMSLAHLFEALSVVPGIGDFCAETVDAIVGAHKGLMVRKNDLNAAMRGFLENELGLDEELATMLYEFKVEIGQQVCLDPATGVLYAGKAICRGTGGSARLPCAGAIHACHVPVLGVECVAEVMSHLRDQLFDEVLQARQRVYAVGKPTPLQRIELPGVEAEVYVKREDLGPIKAYKWRGAYNRMATLTPEQRAGGVVAASAGNHAQGVALAAARLGCQARIFMPRSTPTVKQAAVRMHGGDHVEIVLVGDSYDAASHAAHEYAESNGLTFVHPYDDLSTMGGQGTLADEVVMSGQGPMERVYLQIGGGGLASGCACWFRKFWPGCTITGVEGVEQASMKLAVETGERRTLPYVDVFCDGTAVRIAGENTYELCRELLDGYVTVTNEEVCQAIRALWNSLRVVPEPSGAMGLAALLQDWKAGRIRKGEKCLVVISGANMDFSQLGVVAKRAGVAETNRHLRYLRLPMQTRRGEIIKYLRHIPTGVQLMDVQYGRIEGEIQYPVFGVLGTDEQFAEIESRLAEEGLSSQDVSNDADVNFRMISYDRKHLSHPVFFVIEFPERPGAFIEFMDVMGEYANLCYFNYQYSGEFVGRALVGLEFDSKADRDACRARAEALKGTTIQGIHNLSDSVRRRVLGQMSPLPRLATPC